MKLKQFTGWATDTGSLLHSISLRLLLFNILLVFLPIAAVLYLDVYEEKLLLSQEKSMVQQGRLLSAALSNQGEIEKENVEFILKNLAGRTETRLRVVDNKGVLLADTSTLFLTKQPSPAPAKSKQQEEIMIHKEDTLLYRIAIFPIRVYRKLFNPPVSVENETFYNSTEPLMGKEIQAALEGKYGAVTRLSRGGQRSVTLYTAIPVFNGDEVTGAVLSSQSTYRILKDLYEVRLFIVKIFIASLTAALCISLFLSRTISFRIKKLRKEAQSITTGRGRIKGTFTSFKLKDEIGFLSFSLKDLTDRLDRHIQFIDSFSRDISHEFKNPLAVIRSSAEMIERTEGREQTRFIQLINQNTGRMESLLNGIEEVSRLDSSLDREKKEKIEISDFLNIILEGFRITFSGRNWIFENFKQGYFILANPERLSQIFVNLYENACSFSPRDGKIITSIQKERHQLKITIFNEGPQLPEEDKEKIFTRFYTSRETDKNRHHGLGLSIVKTIVESYGGTVSGENSPGGVSFIILLPLLKS